MSSTPHIVERLAAAIVQAGETPLDAKALRQAREGILDTIGVTLAGIAEPCSQILLRTPGVAEGPGTALIFGTARRTSALDATLINGTASHALDFDDFSGVLGGHQSVPLVPLLFALAEEQGLGGAEVVQAYAVGVETIIRLARAVNFHHYDKGWHPTATLGAFAAAAAASRLLKLDVAQTATALAITASEAAGLKANFGTMTKPLHVGQAGRNGLFAALLAQRGFDAAMDVFEHKQGFLDVFNGPGTYDIEKLFANWCDPWETSLDSIGLKQFPCCGSTHPAIMMALAIREAHAPKADEIEKIEVLPHGRRLRHTDTPDPQTSLDAKFSVQYVVVRALLDGAVRLKDFEGEAHFEPQVQALLARTSARAHPDMADDAAEQWGAEVIVTLKDGTVYAKRVDDMVGRSGANRMSEQELWTKFNDCASRVLPREQVAPLFERLMTLEKAPDMRKVARLMEVSALHKAPIAKVTFAARGTEEAPETTWVP
ncbi:MmgE/PrpD family protein [Paracoccus sp. (in: a-proteobacteria)]|uniref:MmgE/PrpD family protein n=1 Tax=Paracoccus sp. TaxID=267 RepID=UPI002AFFD936|nr:MmgE/PrpD family protein [Paracoccus sp. (in: a-proteobacteria)]